MKYRLIILLIIVYITSGCSAALVPYTNDPYTKLQQACELIDLGRAIPAEKLTKDALGIFKKKGDKLGEAEAYFLLGNFYKSQAYSNYEDFYKNNKLEYTPCCEKSIENYRFAVQVYKEIGDYMGVAKSYFAMGNAYGVDKNISEQCQMFKKSIAAFRKAKELKEGQQKFQIRNPNFKDFEGMVVAFMRDHGCSVTN